MKNYTFYHILSFCLSILLFWSCNDDDDIKQENLQVFVEAGGKTAELTNGATVNFLKTDTLILTVEGGIIAEGSALGDYIVSTSTTDNLHVGLSSKADNVYLVTASDYGRDKLLITDGGNDDNDTYILVSVNIYNPTMSWTMHNNTQDTIDVDSEEVSGEITEELIFKYINSPSKYILEYLNTEFPLYGLLSVIKTDNSNVRDTTYGTFVEQISSGDTLVTMKYDTESYSFRYNETVGMGNYATLTQDLTEEYQNKYPNQSIRNVKDVTSIYHSEVSYELVEVEE